MMPPDIHTLTGAYALHALSEDERAQFEAHLGDCEACDQEVRELQATAADLGQLLHEPPPPALRARVLAEIDTVRQVPPHPGEVPTAVADVATVRDRRRARNRDRWLALLAPAAAIMAFTVIGLTAMVVNLNARLNTMEAAAIAAAQDPTTTAPAPAVPTSTDPALPDDLATLEALLRARDLTLVTLGADGTDVRVVMSPERGEAMLLVSGMDPAPHAHAYGLWLLHVDGQTTPAGLFDVDSHGDVAYYVTADMSTVTALGVTIEPDTGSPAPSTDPLMVVELSS